MVALEPGLLHESNLVQTAAASLLSAFPRARCYFMLVLVWRLIYGDFRKKMDGCSGASVPVLASHTSWKTDINQMGPDSVPARGTVFL